MDNLSNNSMLQTSEVSFSSIDTSDDTGFFSSLKNINATTWLLIILILAILGFNIFVYLAKGTQTVRDILAPLMNMIFGSSLAVTEQTVDVSAEGAKAVVGGTAEVTKAVVGGAADVIEGGLTALQNLTPNGAIASSSVNGQSIQQQQPQEDIIQQSTLNKALNTSQNEQPTQQDYQAYQATTSVHSAGKSGWCFIGQDRGFRSCAEVDVNDTCMSGDIFPSKEICMNPNLRP